MIRLIKKLLLFSPLLLTLILVNFLIDPYRVFSQLDDDDRWIVEKLKAGNNVILDTTVNDRMVQRGYIAFMGAQKKLYDVVVIGSSRALQINSGIFQKKSFFNNSVMGASMEDNLAIVEMYFKNKVKINTLVLGIDPWMFNRNSGMEKWRILELEYDNFLADNFNYNLFDKIALYVRHINSSKEKIKKYCGTLLSLKYFQHSMQKNDFNYESKRYRITENIYMQSPVKLPDGSVINSESMRSADVERVRKDVVDYLAKAEIYGLESFSVLDPNLRLQFEALLQSLYKKNVRVILFLPSFHPLTYNYIKNHQQYRAVIDTEDYLRSLAKEKKMLLIGSYDPQSVGFTEADFYDFMHPKREAVENLFAGIFGLTK